MVEVTNACPPKSAKGGRRRNELFSEAERYILGGVNSPVRSFRSVGGYPVFIKEAKGSKIYSEDGRSFIDYCQSFGALILGHAHLKVIEELKKAIEKGTTFGAPTKEEIELAKIIIEAIPSIERLRLTNSGTEAVMGAVRLARAFTKKDKIIKFKGSYHGHADYLLDCPGIPEDFKKYTMVSQYNDIEAVERNVKKYHKDIAVIIVEPVLGNIGVVLPKVDFLKALRRFCDKYDIVLIFDEVISGFRLTYGGAQEFFGVKADLTCLGKIIGGGLPVGAFGGRLDLMKLLVPEGPVYQAGTFSGNPVTVQAGIATLKILKRYNPYKTLENLTKELCEGVIARAERHELNLKINYIASMFSIDTNIFKDLFHGLLKEGIYLSPSNFETNFLSCAHTDDDIEKTLKAFDNVFSNIKEI